MSLINNTILTSTDNLPDEQQILLLKAALCSGQDCYDNFQNWRKQVDLDDIESASFRLIPLLYENLQKHAVHQIELGKLKGISRYHWCKNQILLKSMTDLLRLLSYNEVDTLVLKGGALIYGYYKRPALRPMSDVDIMVPKRSLKKTVSVMLANGWKSVNNNDITDPSVQKNLHSVEFVDAKGNECDLHWTPLWDATWEGAETHFWETAEPITIQGIDTRIMAPTEQLFHTIVHGSQFNALPPLRWIADAFKVIEKDGERIDWDKLIILGKEYSYLTNLQQGIHFLRSHFKIQMPEEFVTALVHLRAPLTEKLEYQLESRYIPAYRIDMLLLRAWFRHSKQKKNTHSICRLLSFPSYIRTRLKISSFNDIPKAMRTRFAKIRNECRNEKKYWFQTDGRLFSDTALEVMVTDHCNLCCRTCDHLAPVMEERFESPDLLKTDLALLSKSISFRKVKLIGGEPLLHPQLEHIAEVVRDSGICERVLLVTNGTLLSRISDELLNKIDEIEISQYPDACLSKEILGHFKKHAEFFSTKFSIFYYPYFQNQFSLHGTQDKQLIQSIFKSCKRANLWGCHVIYEGHLFRCPQSIYLSKVIPQLKNNPFADGLKITSSWRFKKQALAFFKGKKPLKACAYCLGTVGTLVNHEQVKKDNWLNFQNVPTKALVDSVLLKLPIADLDAHYNIKTSQEFEK